MVLDGFKKRCNDDLEWSIRDYREDLWSKGKKESVEYLRKAKSKWVNRVVKSGFAGGCDEFMDTYYNCVGEKGLEVKSIERYLHDKLKRVRVTKESMEIINEVIEGRRGRLR